jgi:DNA-binding transcriptional LysR family regulator
MDVHLRQLRYFAAVAEEGNFGRAAARLHVTQPTLSQQIAALERHLRTRLLERDPAGVRVTPAGTRLLAASRELLASWQAAEAAISETAAGQRLRVDVWGEFSFWLDTLGDIAAANPSLAPDISMRLGTLAAADALRREEIDLAFGMLTGITLGSGLDSTPVWIQPCGLLVSSRHQFAGRDTVSCAELTGTRILMSPNTPAEVAHSYRSLAARFGTVPVDSVLNLGLLYTLDAVMRDPGLAVVVPVDMGLPPGPDARIVPLTDPQPCTRWSVIWRSGDTNPRLTALLGILARLAAEEGWLSFNPEQQWLFGTDPLSRKWTGRKVTLLG